MARLQKSRVSLIGTLSNNNLSPTNSFVAAVEIHPDNWWILKMEAYGFKYSEPLTIKARQWALAEAHNESDTVRAPNGEKFRCAHCVNSIKVFLNPIVAALPKHQHLFPRHGCFKRYATKEEKDAGKFVSITRPCNAAELETPLPESFQPLSVLPSMHANWDAAIKQGIGK